MARHTITAPYRLNYSKTDLGKLTFAPLLLNHVKSNKKFYVFLVFTCVHMMRRAGVTVEVTPGDLS